MTEDRGGTRHGSRSSRTGHSNTALRLMKSYLSKLEGKYWLPATLHHPLDKVLTQYRDPLLYQIYLSWKMLLLCQLRYTITEGSPGTLIVRLFSPAINVFISCHGHNRIVIIVWWNSYSLSSLGGRRRTLYYSVDIRAEIWGGGGGHS